MATRALSVGPGPRGGRPLARVAVAAALLGGLACGPRGDAASPALRELEGLGFLPPGDVSLPSGFVGPHASWTLDEPLVVDLWETTRAQWERVMGPRDWGSGWSAAEAAAAPDRSLWPAFVSQAEARAYAAKRSMRLPTAAEWLLAAGGSSVHYYPWGRTPQQSVANTLELGLGEPTPVGSFESGRSPFGLYDAIGNAREWVSDRVPGYGDYTEGGAELPASDGYVSAMGGSFKWAMRALYELPPIGSDRQPLFSAHSLDPGYVATDVGVRCVASAEDYLLATCGRWGRSETARESIRAVGQRWARYSGRASRWLGELADAHPERDELAWLAEGARRP